MPALMWFRSDLRLTDNTALNAACREADGVIALFVISAAEWRQHDYSPARINLVLRTLQDLSPRLAALGIPLLIADARTPREVPGIVLETAQNHACTSLHFNREYEVDESRRDEQAARLCKERGIAIHAHHDQAVVPPGLLRTQEDRTYTVFTPFKRTLIARLEESGIPKPHAAPHPRKPLKVQSFPIPSGISGFDSNTSPSLWPAGENEAARRLKAFIAKHLNNYQEERNLPAHNGTSALSPYLAIGAVSPRQCLAAAVAANSDSQHPLSEGNPGAATWISELIWREFYIHILAAFPRVCMGRAFQPATERIRWRESAEDLAAWKEGRTGIPIVDAGMRQLVQTGWMHNRARMVTAMFLSKNLLIDWREGERHFMRHLVDGFFASNNGGWQWSASTGTDAAPYFRVFNPVSQSKKCDPQGEYIRRYVPELRDLDDDAIHEPWTLPELARARLNYPAPIVDLPTSRTRAIEAFRALK